VVALKLLLMVTIEHRLEEATSSSGGHWRWRGGEFAEVAVEIDRLRRLRLCLLLLAAKSLWGGRRVVLGVRVLRFGPRGILLKS